MQTADSRLAAFPRVISPSHLLEESDSESIWCGPPSDTEDSGESESRALEAWGIHESLHISNLSACIAKSLLHIQPLIPRGQSCDENQELVFIIRVGLEDVAAYHAVDIVLDKASNMLRIFDECCAKVGLDGGVGDCLCPDDLKLKIPFQINVSCRRFGSYLEDAFVQVLTLFKHVDSRIREYFGSKHETLPAVKVAYEGMKRYPIPPTTPPPATTYPKPPPCCLPPPLSASPRQAIACDRANKRTIKRRETRRRQRDREAAVANCLSSRPAALPQERDPWVISDDGRNWDSPCVGAEANENERNVKERNSWAALSSGRGLNNQDGNNQDSSKFESTMIEAASRCLAAVVAREVGKNEQSPYYNNHCMSEWRSWAVVSSGRSHSAEAGANHQEGNHDSKLKLAPTMSEAANRCLTVVTKAREASKSERNS